ncbi:MAG: hypothetical protein NVS3B6_15240 [Pseudarthrobacter sp.]
MVQGLLDFQLRVASAVDDVAVDHYEVRLLRIQGLVHELDGAAIRLFVILGVVELHHFELAVGAESKRGLRRLRAGRGHAGACG